jgi:1-acyl-sn-glycerol-3-phosphate acyltransferase
MIQAVRYVVSFIVFMAIAGLRVIGSALLGVKHRPGGVYDAAARGWGRRMLWGTGITVQIEGRERLDPNTPCVYISNHTSFIDIWAILAEFPGTVRFVYKKGMDWIPVMGLAMRAARHIPIDRKNHPRAFAAYEVAADHIRQGTSAVVFAEGTRSVNGRLMKFKKGPFVLAIAAQAPVIPVYCHNTYELMPRRSWSPKRGTVTLRIGAPIPTAGLSYSDRDALADRVRKAMVSLGARE